MIYNIILMGGPAHGSEFSIEGPHGIPPWTYRVPVAPERSLLSKPFEPLRPISIPTAVYKLRRPCEPRLPTQVYDFEEIEE